VEREAQRDLEILTELARGELVTQRRLAQRLGIALGLTNLYLKRLARKGYIKITTMPPRRIRYLLTPKGIARKSRLTCEYMEYSVHLYRETRQLLRQALRPVVERGKRRVAIYDTGEAAELAFLTLQELGLEVTAVFGQDGRRGTFVGLPVRPLADLTASEQDVVIVASFARPDGLIATLTARGLPRDRIVTLRQ
jgi:DNA-binding MarR family transcriptional regulator